MTYTQHPLSAVLPPLSATDHAKLRADIARDGLLFAIWLFEGMVLDGWHRYRICLEVGVEPRFEVFDRMATRRQLA
jgi:hypothetical protein